MKTKTAIVPLSEIKVNLFVRKTLNQEHVLYLAELIENKVTLPPIKVTLDRMVIDGRHRIEAYELNKMQEVTAEIIDLKDEAEMISEAYRANLGGSLPPTPQDIEHTVMLLLERGESKKRISELLGLPPGMTRRYATEVQSRMSRAKLQRAADAVTDGGLTVHKAAEQYEVSPEKLKEILSGSRRKNKNGVTEMRRAFTLTYKSVSQKNASALRRLITEKFADGDVTEKQVREIIEHLENLQKGSSRSVADWKKRFEAMANGKGEKA